MELTTINMKLTKIFLLCLISILFSCKENLNEGVISDTDTLLVNDPKRAIAILDSLEQVSSLNEKERMHLVWNRALAHQAYKTLFYVQEAVDGNYRNGGLEGISYYKDDIIFVGSQVDANLWQYKLDGTMLSKVSLSDFATEVAGLCYDPENEWIWVADSNESKLFVCTPDGTLVATYDLPEIENAESVCVDRKNDCVWVGSDEDSPKLYRLEFQF